MDIGLNQRQKMFASEYIRTGNVYQSAIFAGYSEAYAKTTASKLLENASIKTFIQTETEKMHDEIILSAKEALSILSDIARGKRLEEVLMMNPVTGEVDRVTKKADNNKYKYPFRLQYANQYLDLSGIFEDGQEYTAVEICKLMLQHGYFSFSAEQTSFDFRPEENVLVAYGKQYKKG